MNSVQLLTSVAGAQERAVGLRERKKLETWRLLRRTALRLITELGYDQVTVDLIAAQANVSRTTFFNYFTSKEAVVFDPDPEEPQRWAALMAARPADEPVWTSLREIMIGNLAEMGELVAAQRTIKLGTPSLATSSRESGDRFLQILREWAVARDLAAGGSPLHAALLVSAAQAASMTAYGQWSPDDCVEELHTLIRSAFAIVGDGLDP